MKKLMMTVVLAAGAAFGLSAMPTKAETERVEPSVQKKLASAQAALKEGRMTRAEVAAAAMKLADKADTDAEKLLLMKGAFSLYVKDGNLEKAVETMKALKAAIPDLPPENITNMADTALQGADRNVDGARLRQLLADAKVLMPQETVNGYTWSYQVKNGEATICTVSSKPTGNVSIPATLKGLSVTGIGDKVFEDCRAMKSVAIPASVKTIGEKAFANCGGLTSLSIPQGVTSIGRWAFANCRGVKSVSHLEGLTEINGGVFYNAGVTSVVIPPQVRNIGDGAFARCDGLGMVMISSGVTNVSEGAFGACGELKFFYVDSANTYYCSRNGMLCSKDGLNLIAGVNGEVSIPEGVTNICPLAFGDLNGLRTLTIPASVKSISGNAFKYGDYFCDNLTSVTMLGDRPNAPDGVFKGCDKLKSIHVPANAKSWAGMKEWQGIPLVFDAKVDGVAAAKDRTTIQSIIDGMIKVPGRDYWLSETELTQGQWEAVMGYNYSKHKGANLPVDHVSRNECDVFLEKLNQTKEVLSSQFEFALPKYAEEWVYAAHAGGEGDDCWIKPGVVGNTLDMEWMKENSSNQTHAVATKSANAFGFYDMVGNVREWCSENDGKGHGYAMGGWCGQGASQFSFGIITLVDLSERGGGDLGLRVAAHMRSTGDKVKWTYEDRKDGIVLGGVWKLAVPTNTTGALIIPAAIDGKPVREIGFGAFQNCRGLISVTIPEGVKAIWAHAFRDCSGLESVNISMGVTHIDAQAFDGCRSMKSLTLPPSVKVIGAYAFRGCGGLASVTIPSSVASVADGAFFSCDKVTSVTMCGECPKSGENVFGKCRKLAAIHVPANAKSWAGMKAWQGIPLVFDAKVDGVAAAKDRTTIQSIIDGMIEVPGGNFYLSETELTQGQWESVMGNNPSMHKGPNLPVENVSRDDCDAFLEKLNHTKEARASQFEFCLPPRVGWADAARAGSGHETKLIPFVKHGVVGDLLDMAWLKENSDGKTHDVATKTPNAYGFYDMVGNVEEYVIEPDVFRRRGYSYTCGLKDCRPGYFWMTDRNRRAGNCGLRVAAHIRPECVK